MVIKHELLSVCGLLCDECEHFNQLCKGCYSVKGSTFWAKETMPDKICPIFKCSITDKRYTNCGQCSELPCRIFHELKDPSLSDNEHQKSIQDRTTRLNDMKVSPAEM
jgi:hypothetical protein